jgi:hypothetical protein
MNTRVYMRQVNRACARWWSRYVDARIYFGTRPSKERTDAEAEADRILHADLDRAELMAKRPSSWWKHLNIAP